jgi:fructokinase
VTTDSPAAVPVDVPSDVLVESSSEAPDVLVVGEALIDAVDPGGSGAGVGGGVTEHVGGSPANVAFGLAALGHPVRLATWFGRDDRGARIARACTEHGVRLVAGSDGADHTSLAQATLDAHGQASYRFDLTWQVPSAAGVDPVGIGHVHTGSIAATLEPGGTHVLALIEALHGSATVSYDPNIRPSLMGSPDEVRDRIEAIIALVDVVKASDEDLQPVCHRGHPGRQGCDVCRALGHCGAGHLGAGAGRDGHRHRRGRGLLHGRAGVWTARRRLPGPTGLPRPPRDGRDRRPARGIGPCDRHLGVHRRQSRRVCPDPRRTVKE